jgi:hypothetical protein
MSHNSTRVRASTKKKGGPFRVRPLFAGLKPGDYCTFYFLLTSYLPLTSDL